MRRAIPVVIATAWLLAASTAHGQDAAHTTSRNEAVVSGVLVLPQGNWSTPVHSIAGGGGFHALFPVASSPVSFGIDGQALFYETPRQSSEQILTVHGLLRIGLGTRRARYVEAFGGIKGFSVDPSVPGTYSYGFGVGIQFPIASRSQADPHEKELIEIGVRYLKGGGVRLTPETTVSSTDSVMVYAGWGFRF